MEYNIVSDPDRQRFTTTVDGNVAYVEYIITDGYLDITHTIVPKPIGGRGIAAALVKNAYEYAAANGLKPKATCSYAVTWLARHPEMKPNE